MISGPRLHRHDNGDCAFYSAAFRTELLEARRRSTTVTATAALADEHKTQA